MFPYVCKISYGLGHIRQVFDESMKFGIGWDATTTQGSMPPFSADQRVFAVAFAPMFIALRNWSTGASSSINLAYDKVVGLATRLATAALIQERIYRTSKTGPMKAQRYVKCRSSGN